MELKEFISFPPEDIKEWLENYYHKAPAYRLHFRFEDYLDDLKVCPICGEINEIDEMVYHKWDVGQVEELICEGCRNDESF